MKFREPPRFAVWLLRNISAGEYDEALEGDLLEVFGLGRSNAWYWRQVLVACVLSWMSRVVARGPALVFALAWSMLSPAWYSVLQRFGTAQNFDRGEGIFGQLWLPLVLIAWVVLHAAFLWAGLLVFHLAHFTLGDPLPPNDLRRAFWIAALMLPLPYCATFLFANLYWWSIPGLADARLAATLCGQVSDLGVLADFTRIPYLLAMVIALWGTVHHPKREEETA
jgi:hypothetical protein